jgi:hypothetical protein
MVGIGMAAKANSALATMTVAGMVAMSVSAMAGGKAPNKSAEDAVEEPVEELIDEITDGTDLDGFEVEADSTAADYFVSAPTSIFPTIDVMTRMDMIDYFQAGSSKASANLMGGDCRVTSNSYGKITVSTSAVSDYTIDLLPAPSAKRQTIVMVTRTLKTPTEDSSVKFYDCNWKPLGDLLPMPALREWVLPSAKKQMDDIENAVPFVMATLTYDPATQNATLTNNIQEYIGQESKELVDKTIAKSLSYHWNGKKFVLVK